MTTAAGDQCDVHGGSPSVGVVDPTTQHEAVLDRLDRDVRSARQRRDRLRGRACHSSPLTDTSPSRCTSASSPTSVRDADLDGIAAGLDDPGERDAEQEHERARDRERRPERHLVGGPGRVEEHQRADHERDRAGERQRSVGRSRARRSTKRPSATSEQEHACDGHGQHLEAVETDEQRDRPDGAREERDPGFQSSTSDPDDPEREHQRDDVRVDQEVERLLPATTSRRSRRVAPAVSSVRPFGVVTRAVDRLEQSRAASARRRRRRSSPRPRGRRSWRPAAPSPRRPSRFDRAPGRARRRRRPRR